MTIQDFVDFRLRTILEKAEEPEEISQLTLRIPLTDRYKADVLSEFLMASRNTILAAVLSDGLEIAFQRLKDNPVTANNRYNDMTPDEALQALIAGKSIANGMSFTEIGEYVQNLKNKGVAP